MSTNGYTPIKTTCDNTAHLCNIRSEEPAGKKVPFTALTSISMGKLQPGCHMQPGKPLNINKSVSRKIDVLHPFLKFLSSNLNIERNTVRLERHILYTFHDMFNWVTKNILSKPLKSNFITLCVPPFKKCAHP